MCKVVLDHKKCSEFFNVYSFQDEYYNFYVTTMNEDCIEYLKYIKCYGLINPPRTINYAIKHPSEKNDYWDKETFYENEILEFEFPDEETAFYFKLKYC